MPISVGRPSKKELKASALMQAFFAATSGQVGTWYDGLTGAQKNALDRELVILIKNQEERITALETKVG